MFSGGLVEELTPETPAVQAPAAEPAPVVSTEAGRYLQGAARDEPPSRYGTPAHPVDDAALRVWEIAFGLAVRRRFEPDTPLPEISRTVATAVHDHAAAAIPPLDAEMLVRDALGEAVPVDGIDPAVRLAVHLLLFASLTDGLALGDTELDALIAEAENRAQA
jgi:hypothetical protein